MRSSDLLRSWGKGFVVSTSWRDLSRPALASVYCQALMVPLFDGWDGSEAIVMT